MQGEDVQNKTKTEEDKQIFPSTGGAIRNSAARMIKL